MIIGQCNKRYAEEAGGIDSLVLRSPKKRSINRDKKRIKTVQQVSK